MPEPKRPLKVFLCHAHSDATAVRSLYSRLRREGVDVWLDKEKLLPGADWELEIRKAVREADVVVVCLSKQFNQAGFRQKEVQIALDTAMEQPEGEIFIIPARLEECENLDSLRKWHWVNLYETDGHQKLIRALRTRADRIGATLIVRRGRRAIASYSVTDKSSNDYQVNRSPQTTDQIKQQRPGFAITITAKSIDDWYEVAATSIFLPGREVHTRFKIPYSEEYIDEMLDLLSYGVQNPRGGHVNIPSSNDDGDDKEKLIDAFGQRLYEALFSREVGKLYADALEKAISQFPISIITDIPEIIRLPWEFLHDGRGFICTNVGPIFRVISDAKPSVSDLQVTESLKLLIVPSNPPGSQNLDVEAEEEEIRSILREAPIEIFKPESQRVESFQKKLLAVRPHIIHFIGHGDKTGIRFKTETGGIINIGDVLREMFYAAGFLPRIIILNACTTDALAVSLVKKRVPMVVAMQFRISDRAAIAFSRGFYEYIAAGLPIQEATSWGRLAIKSSLKERGQFEWATPVIYVNPKVMLK